MTGFNKPSSWKYAEIAAMDCHYAADDNDFPIETRIRIYSDINNLLDEEDEDEISEDFQVGDPLLVDPKILSNNIAQVVSEVVANPTNEESSLMSHIEECFLELKNLYYDFAYVWPNGLIDVKNDLKDVQFADFDLLISKLIDYFNAWQGYCVLKQLVEPTGVLGEIEGKWKFLASRMYFLLIACLPSEEMRELLRKETFIQMVSLTQSLRFILYVRHLKRSSSSSHNIW